MINYLKQEKIKIESLLNLIFHTFNPYFLVLREMLERSIFLISFFYFVAPQLILKNSPCLAQNITHTLIGTPSEDFGGLYQTENGIYLAGYTSVGGSEDMYIVKLNDKLEINWSKIYGSNVGDRAYGIIEKSNGNLLISGFGSSGSSSALLEIDDTGDIVRSTGFGRLLKTIDGGYLNYGELEGAVPGHNKVALIKYDANMNIEWKKYYDNSFSSDNNSSYEVYGRQVVQLNDESYALLCSYTQFRNATNSRKIRVIKIDKNGDEKWTRGFHGGKMDNAHHMILCQDGGFLISATTNSYSNNQTDILLVKADSNGVLQWYKTYGGWQDELAGQILEKENGHFVVSGSSKSFGAIENDYLLFEIDQVGNLLKAHTYGSEGDDVLTAMDTTQGYIVLSGSSNGFDQFNNNIYLVKTKFDKATSECSSDVTAMLITNAPSHITYFDERYSSGSFESPSNRNLNVSSSSSFKIEACLGCPEGEIKSGILCPEEEVRFNYEHDSIISVTWYSGSTEPFSYFTDEGTYWIDIETAHCFFRDTIVIMKEQPLDLDLGQDQYICQGDTLLLDASNSAALDFEWQDGSNEPSYIVTNSGIFYVDVGTENCAIRDSITITMEEPYDIELGDNKILCYDETLVLDASGPGALSYEWQDGSNDAKYEISVPGVYFVNIETEHCHYSDTVVIVKQKPLYIDLGEDKILCHGETITLDASEAGALDYKWQDGSNDSIYYATKPGLYHVLITSACEVLSDSIELISPIINELRVPNVITPNNDGFNDHFKLPATDYPVTLSIINRWGKKVFISNAYSNNWGGNNLPSGVYYYHAKVGCTNQEYKGWLHILKD